MYRLILLALTVLAASASAGTFNINASERGWVCTGGSACGTGFNNGASPSNNYFAGSNSPSELQVRDWFEFSIPTLTGGSLVSATLNLDEPGGLLGGHAGGTLTFAVYGLNAQPLVLTDVTTSNPFGSVNTSSASNGTTVSIVLNAAALAAIAAAQTSNIFIGGIDSGENSLNAADFLNTGFTPPLGNTVLSLTTAPASSVPEPSSLLLLATAAALVGWGRKIRAH